MKTSTKHLVLKIAQLKHKASELITPSNGYWELMDSFDQLMLDIESQAGWFDMEVNHE